MGINPNANPSKNNLKLEFNLFVHAVDHIQHLLSYVV